MFSYCYRPDSRDSMRCFRSVEAQELRFVTGLRRGEPGAQSEPCFLEQPPAPHIHTIGSDAPCCHECRRSLVEIVGGHPDPRVARDKGFDLKERRPHLAQGFRACALLDPGDGLLDQAQQLVSRGLKGPLWPADDQRSSRLARTCGWLKVTAHQKEVGPLRYSRSRHLHHLPIWAFADPKNATWLMRG